ncbi:MAG: hypothetical protein ACLTXM_07460 [Enterococcus sp.]
MSKLDEFAVFILSNGRADNIKTVKTLEKQGYTGKTYIIIDDQDEQSERYYSRYRDQVIMFDKEESAKCFDVMDNFHDLRSVVYARNQVHRIAKDLGYTYFLELDDDYSSFLFRYVDRGKLKNREVPSLDRLFEIMLNFLDESGSLTVALAQGGDFIGGAENKNFHKGLLRKAMNSFFCRTDRPFQFVGNINEDTNMYVDLGRRGELIFTVSTVMLNQTTTQANAGGLSTIYLDQGTYVKSFYTVMLNPSSVSVAPMGGSHLRLHHKINWNNTVPKIIHEKYKK